MIWNVIPILKMLTLCARNPPVMDGFLVQRVSNVGFDVFFVVSLNIGLKEQWFEMSYPSSKWFTCLLTLCARNPPVMDGFLVQRVSNVGFDVFFVVSLNIELKEQWFEMSYPSSKCWPFVPGILQSWMDSLYKGSAMLALMSSLLLA